MSLSSIKHDRQLLGRVLRAHPELDRHRLYQLIDRDTIRDPRGGFNPQYQTVLLENVLYALLGEYSPHLPDFEKRRVLKQVKPIIQDKFLNLSVQEK